MDDNLYQQTILRLAAEGKAPRVLQHADGAARIDNPLCGDRVDAQVRLAGERIEEVGFTVRGCRLCEAAAAMVTQGAPGRSMTEWSDIAAAFDTMVRNGTAPPPGLPDAGAFAPVHGYKSRHDCPLLPLQALGAAIREAKE